MRWIIRIVCFVLFLVAVVVGGILLLPKDRLASIAAGQLSKVLGRDVQLTGAARPSFYPTLGVQVEGLQVAAPDWADDPQFISADGLSVALDVPALFQGNIQVGEVVIENAVVRLIRNADGQTTWDLAAAKPTTEVTSEAEAVSQTRTVSLDNLSLSNATVLYKDDVAGVSYQLTDTDAKVSLATNGDVAVSLAGALQGERITLTADVAEVFELLDGTAQAVMFNAGIGKATVNFDGTMSADGTANGRVDADITDLNAILRVAGQTPTSLPAGVRERLAINGTIAASPNKISLTGGTFHVGPNTLKGTIAVALDGKPNITGALAAGALNLKPFLGSGGNNATAGNGDAASGQGWSKASIDVSGLSAANADVAVTANSVDLGDFQLGQTDLRATLDNSRLVLGLNKIEGFNGTVAGQFVVNGRSGLSMGGDLKAQNVSLKQLLNGLLGFEKLDGPGSAQFKFLASGSSMDALMKSLSGNAALNIGSGELRGVDLARLFGRQTEDGGGTTIFDSMTTIFEIQNGTMNTSDLAILAPVFQALGEGQIGLGDQTINFLVQPEVFRGEIGGIKVPVRIKGPWSKLRIYPDLEFLAKQELAEREAELKAAAEAKLAEEKRRAEERLKQQAAEALNIELQEGQSLEDAARDKIENELRRGLGNLLGGN